MAGRGFRVIAIAACVLSLAAAAAVTIAATVELRPLVERYAAKALQRKITFGELRIRWGAPLSLEIRDLRLANASWGSAPDMLGVTHLSADIEPWPLLRGIIRYRKLVIEGFSLLLERGQAGQPNWHFGENDKPSAGSLAIIPANRAQFPSLRDLSLREGKFIYRLPGSPDLRLDIADMAIRSADDAAPVAMNLDGTYNGLPIRLNGDMASFSDLRNGAKPFHTVLSIRPPSGTLAFEGTTTDPLNFDGMKGQFRVETRKLGTILEALGTGAGFEVPLSLSGTLDRAGDQWKLDGARGALAGNAFTGSLALAEAKRGQPDGLSMTLDFPRLELDGLVPGGTRPEAQGRKSESLSLLLDNNPSVVVRAAIDAGELTYGGMKAKNFTARGQTGAGSISVGEISFDYGGGRATASGESRTAAGGSRLTASMDLSQIELGDVARLLDAPAGEITGKLDGRATLDMTGGNLQEALSASQGQAVMKMARGGMSRALLEKVSTDIRTLFRTSPGSVEVSCLLTVAILDGGVATMSPFRMRTPDATLIAGGTVDMTRRKIDLTMETVGNSTSLFALDVPIRLVGGFGDLHALPDAVPADLLHKAERDSSVRKLPPELRRFAEGNPCIR